MCPPHRAATAPSSPRVNETELDPSKLWWSFPCNALHAVFLSITPQLGVPSVSAGWNNEESLNSGVLHMPLSCLSLSLLLPEFSILPECY